jgi:hypothetical protein
LFSGLTDRELEIPTELFLETLSSLSVRAVFGKAIELERLIRDPRVLGLLETELRLPLLGFAMLRRDVELEGETIFVVPDINFWGFENFNV